MADPLSTADPSIQNCLNVLKRFLLCPIWNPQITPCAHVFCKFCIQEHIGKKRKARCPLCNREFTRRSLKASEKFTNITEACEKVIKAYESEVGAAVLLSNVPSEHLHLSQELSQRVVQVDDFTSRTQTSNNIRKAAGSRSTVDQATLRRPKRTSRTRVVLGTTARLSNLAVKARSCSESFSTDELQSTQPMNDLGNTSPEQVHERGVTPGATEALFILTQQTQPMSLELDEFTAVEGMGTRSTQKLQPNPIEFSNLERTSSPTALAAEDSAVPLISALPPRPPLASKHPIGLNASRKRITNSRSSDVPSKHCKIESNVTECSSINGVLTKTHEVVCHVQPSGSLASLNADNSVMSTASSRETKRQLKPKVKLKSSLSGSIKLLSRKEPRYSVRSSVESSEKQRRLSNTSSFKSPGWSRWRAMYRELRRRSSSASLSFRSKAKTDSISHRKQVQNDHISPSNRSPQDTSLATEIRDVDPGSSIPFSRNHCKTSNETISSCSSKPCNFVAPLRRLFARKSSRLSLNKPSLTFVTSPTGGQVTGTGLLAKSRTSNIAPTIYCHDSTASSVTSMVDAACGTPAKQCLHCSACGEALLLDSQSLSSLLSPLSRTDATALPSQLSCSFSSSYWQAEDPGDSAFSDVNLDKLVHVNRKSVMQPSRDVADAGCQTLFDTELILETSASTSKAKRMPSIVTTSNNKSPTVNFCEACPNSSTVAAPSQRPVITASDSQPVSPLLPETETVKLSDDEAQLGSPDELPGTDCSSTYHASSGELMPTIDRERLRSECNELEAVVAALQQQLDAQVGELSPNTTAELLRAAGTEPTDEEVDVFGHSKPPISLNSVRLGDSTCHSTEVIQGTNPMDQECELRETIEQSERNTAGVLTQINEVCESDGMEVIPSSQTEEEELETEHTSSAASQQTKLTAIPVVTQSSTQLSRVTHVDPSQPSVCPNSICEAIAAPSMDAQLARNQADAPSISELTECPETNLETQSSRHFTELEQTKVPLATLAVTGSNLTAMQMMLLRSFCRHFAIAEHTRFTPGKTTHIVMAPEPDRPRVVKRTLKYFMGILNRAWIVNTDWIRQSLAAGLVLDETPYEIEGDTVCGDSHEGPRRGRLKVPAQPPSVTQVIGIDTVSNCGPFAGLWLCAYGSLGLLSLPEFLSLALDGGASRVFEKPVDLAAAADKFLKSQPKQAKPRAVILTSFNPPEFDLKSCEKIYHKYGFAIVNIDWMLNCISLYRRIPISEGYRICPAAQHNRVPLAQMNHPR